MASAAKGGYDPKNSRVSEDKINKFIGAAVEADLESVPGVGPATKKCFIAAGVKTTHQLFGKFLLLKDPSFTTQQHCDAFYDWIKGTGAKTGHRAGMVKAVASKADTFIHGLYDEDDL